MKIALSPVAGAVGWFRCMGPGFCMQEKGHEVALLVKGATREEDFPAIVREADVILIHGPGTPYETAPPEWRERSGALVFELDDDMWAWRDEPCRKGVVSDADLERWLATAESWARAADLCVTTNERLAAVLRTHGAQEVAVCDNGVPEEALELVPPKTRPVELLTVRESAARAVLPCPCGSGKKAGKCCSRPGAAPKREGVAIGWTGTAVHRLDLPPVARAVRRLMTWDPRLNVRALGQADWRTLEDWKGFEGGFNNYFHVMVKKGDGSFTANVPFLHYYDALAGMAVDLAVIPLEDRPFNQSKSAITLYGWGALRVPVVCSRVGPYAQAEKDGFPAVYVDHHDEKAWGHAIQALADNPFERERLGNEAHDYVAKHHAFPAAAAPWERALARAVELHGARKLAA